MDPILVAALDFGTTHFRFGASYFYEYKKNPTCCFTLTSLNLHAPGRCLQSAGTPSCILFDKNGEFHSCGFKAQTKYEELSSENEHHEWMFFERLKTNLYQQIDTKRHFESKAENGKLMDAKKVFSEIIKYLQNQLMYSAGYGITMADIRFVITVPAIWTVHVKQFMREAAQKAGIEKENLLFVLESEAASLFCKRLPVERLVGSGSGLNVFSPGSTYILLDAGVTTDITACEVQRDGTIKEIQKRNGEKLCGTMVDDAFQEFIEGLVGRNVFEKFRKDEKIDFMEFFQSFQETKHTFNPNSTDNVYFRFPKSIFEIYEQLNHCNIKDNIRFGRCDITFIGDKIRLNRDIVKGFFSNAINHIVQHIEQILLCRGVSNTGHILMVGGFSESPMLQNAVKNAFHTKKVVVPDNAALAVLIGALIIGHEYSIV